MKNLFLVLAMTGILPMAQAQKVKTTSVPVAVTTAFNKSHQTVKDVEWSLKDGNIYEAEFDENKSDVYVTYEATGNLIETKTEIEGVSLPAPVMSYVKQNYKEDEVRKAFKITNAFGTVTYVAKVKDMLLLFDANGTFIKTMEK